MAVVTISRTMGSGGDYIGRELASVLGYKFVDKDKIAAIIKDYGIIRLDDIYNSVSHFWDRMDEYRNATVKFLTETILAAAQYGDIVIAGRGSFGILHNFSGVVHVRIQAPFRYRVINIAEREDISLEEAESLVLQDDRHRRKFIESYLYFEPYDVNLFDVVLDTSVVEPDVCVEAIRQICEKANPDVRSDTLKSLDDLEVDPVLHKHIAQKLV